MPTARRRYQITETPDVARAIDQAARRWPGEPRSKLLVRTIMAGGDSLTNNAESERRLAAIRRTQGQYTDAYGDNYLRELRDDWPT
jgi:hypothetical protein